MSEAAPAPRPPRAAATVVLLRARDEREPDGAYDVYLVRRPKRAGFMPDSHVFPGGKVEAADGDPRLGGDAALAAAVREAFEECGVLLAADSAGVAPDTALPALADARRALLAGERTLVDVLDEGAIAIARDRIQPWAHWITPSGEPIRFSARFFVARVPPGQVASHAPGELVDEVWTTPPDALAREVDGTIRLPPPTYFTIYELSRLPTLAAVEAAARTRSIATILPKFLERGESTTILLPWDPEYESAPGESLAVPKDFVPPPWSRHVLERGKWWRR